MKISYSIMFTAFYRRHTSELISIGQSVTGRFIDKNKEKHINSVQYIYLTGFKNLLQKYHAAGPMVMLHSYVFNFRYLSSL